MKIAIIGTTPIMIIHALLQSKKHDVTIFERSNKLGGAWAYGFYKNIVFSEKLLSQKQVDEVRTQLKKIDFDHFKKIFENFSEGNQKGLDFYRIKNILTDEIMGYPLMQRDEKYGLLIFDYPIGDEKTNKILNVINGVLKNPEIPSTPPPETSDDE